MYRLIFPVLLITVFGYQAKAFKGADPDGCLWRKSLTNTNTVKRINKR